MPVTIRQGTVNFKDSSNEYVPINAVAQQTSEAEIAAIQSLSNTEKSAIQSLSTTEQAAIQSKGTETLASIPNDYTALSDEVDELKSATNSLCNVIPTLTGNQVINPANFEIGGIYIPENPPWNYEWSNKRVRTAEGFAFDVKKGDVVYLSDYTDAKFSAFVESGTSYRRTLNKTSGSFSVTFDGKLRLVLMNQTEKVLTQSDVTDLLSRLRIEGSSGYVQVTDQKLENDEDNIDKLFARMQNEDGIVNIDAKDFETGTLYFVNSSTPWQYQYSEKRVRLKENKLLQLPSGAVISLSTYTGYRLSVMYKVGSTYYDSGWRTADFVLPYDASVALMISANPEATISNIQDYVDLISIRTKLQIGDKSYAGEKIVTKNNGYTWISNSVFDIPSTDTIATYGFTVTSYQALAYHNGYMLVSYSDDVLAICNASTGAVVSVISAEIGHANAMQFSDVFYDDDDAFPLLYVTKSLSTDTTTVAVIRLATTAAATTIKTLTVNGNYGVCAVDNISGNLIAVTYQATNVSVASGNKMDVKRYDITGETPTLLSSGVIDFIPTMQDAEIINGMMFIVSYGLTATPAASNKIYVLDIGTLTIRNVLTGFDNYYANVNENEGITFVNGDLYTNAARSTRKAIFLD